MKKITDRIAGLLAGAMLVTACQKEEPLQPSDKDENYLVVHDNPSDSADHAIYRFYQSTGIPLFYNDTIARRHTGDSAGIPQYFYIRLALNYAPPGSDERLKYALPKSRQQILPMLDLLKQDLLPHVPRSIFVPSFLLVDSLGLNLRFNDYRYFGLNAYSGFNTVAVRSVETSSLSAKEKNRYIASVLATLAAKKLSTTQAGRLDDEFYGVSRRQSTPPDIYEQNFSFLFPDGTHVPEDFGLIYYYDVEGTIYTTGEPEDLRSYLEAVFYETTAAFHAAYAGYPPVLEKFDQIKKMARELGFQFTD